MTCTVIAFYAFTPLPDFARRREPLLAACTDNGISGTILLAAEGINGTVAGPADGIDRLLACLRAIPGCAGLDVKWSTADANPFYRMKVRLKREIVTMGVPGVDTAANAGEHVEPEDWNALIGAPDVAVIDTRNDYEVGIGTFDNAVNPRTDSFSDFPAWLEAHAAELKGKRLAMFCTGGIRCEKATALAKDLGFKDVFHLKGGILNYLEKVPEADSAWHGECFVFDQRVAVGHGLKPGTHTMCHACRMPLGPADREAPDYVEGISCPHCRNVRSDQQRKRYAARQHQVERADAEGRIHIGTAAREQVE